ncbi:phosphatase PAP2 family protein [Methylocella tundrae]|jgi:undecaprenyl-diphosphatase|uniref:Phosphoesterase PA-phosphatase related n=1 Tax=Methylocella tundrae TaxID=227605 RepID=A0A4U8Z050_METTU|nr:phosphatase PAP2 family protein [Methylocella tundrae]WPP05691.1 phosphatase PAP2 family protein [Methylocella tundrae]VFU08173.1 Phosphoesterase PA-phosphatase related [Methylocella tundrae]
MIEEASIINGTNAELELGELIPGSGEPSQLDAGRCATLWASSKQRLSAADLVAVHFFSRSVKWRIGRTSAVVISKLGNGWLYPILALIIFGHFGEKAIRVILAAGLNAGLLHCLYPAIKRYIGRPRPFRTDARLSSLFGVLDEHSFPSGHAMTLSGVLVPIVLAWPDCLSVAAALMLLMGWARIASGHHYPSDICAGAALGFILAYPLSAWALSI